jgi:anion-transporting  ArsA/GET3 family ATPase
MTGPRLLFVTGKGGVGKTTVAAAIGLDVAAERRRVLIVELTAERGLARLFERDRLDTEPSPLAPHLDAVRVEQRPLVEAYFRRALKFRFLSERLLSSITFNALTTAAPGVTEFMVLEHLRQWVDAGRWSPHPYDLVVVDAPATGHAIRLLRTPAKLAALVPAGPIGGTARHLVDLLLDHDQTQVLLVAIADEMAVNETLEARRVLGDEMGLQLTRPVLNRVLPRRFDRHDQEQIDQLCEQQADDPLLTAARVQIAARREVEQHRGELCRAFGTPPVSLQQVYRHGLGRSDLEKMGRAVGRALWAP